MTSQKYVVITRPKEESKNMEYQLHQLDLKVLSLPSISLHKTMLSEQAINSLKGIASFDWIVFTSKNGITYFVKALQELHIDISILKEKHIAAVGPKTAEEIKKYGFGAHFIPSEFTTEDLAKQLFNIQGKKILLPRANIASPLLADLLREKGADVINIPIYTTEFVSTPIEEFKTLLEKKEVLCITFTSPSTVEGFLKNTKDLHDKILSLPALSIGPVTTSTLKKYGFTNIYMANTFTTEGMISKLKESIL